ncbi:hypothetical protein [Desulfofustis limnaeus]|jgi:hypothetical protein|uniref:Uncharacterized protein n=1 Tax=Desulfofustis limnaeus TaxID=2740163 RepID=A0ABM7WBE3_9BACT|nr:hypothetical protein [Desulfofustis limnaeus]MDX9896439.1 hypothetical protein [Desulfofustis sp.]BDD88229.1 hypothetical protein DPPLL_25940 [Desulfofustis limnaeus]
MRRLFSGIYSWDGKKHGSRTPIAWFPGSYFLDIVAVERGTAKVALLRPYLCVFQETGKGHSISADPERFARSICEDFSLDPDRVLWVEKSRQPDHDVTVVLFTKTGRLGSQDFFRISKRPPSAAERRLIEEMGPTVAEQDGPVVTREA